MFVFFSELRRPGARLHGAVHVPPAAQHLRHPPGAVQARSRRLEKDVHKEAEVQLGSAGGKAGAARRVPGCRGLSGHALFPLVQFESGAARVAAKEPITGGVLRAS